MSSSHLIAGKFSAPVLQIPSAGPSVRPVAGRVAIAPPEKPIAIAELPVDRGITTRQAAAILGCKEDTMKKWRLRGQGPKFMKYLDGSVRYRLSTILKFMDDCTVQF